MARTQQVHQHTVAEFCVLNRLPLDLDLLLNPHCLLQSQISTQDETQPVDIDLTIVRALVAGDSVRGGYCVVARCVGELSQLAEQLKMNRTDRNDKIYNRISAYMLFIAR